MATLTAGRRYSNRTHDKEKIAQMTAWAAVLLFVLLAGSWVHLWASEARFSGLCQTIAGQAADDNSKKLQVFAETLKSQFCF